METQKKRLRGHSVLGLSPKLPQLQRILCFVSLLSLFAGGHCQFTIVGGGNYEYFSFELSTVEWFTAEPTTGCSAYPTGACPVDPSNSVYSSLVGSVSFYHQPTSAACCTAYVEDIPPEPPVPVVSNSWVYGLTCTTLFICRWESGVV